MFRKTLIRLTLLNAGIFIILISVLGAAVYLYTANVLYRSVDRVIHRAEDMTLRARVPGFQGPREIWVLYWDDQKRFIGPEGQFPISDEVIAKLKPGALDRMEERKVDGVHYRWLATRAFTPRGVVIVQFIANVNPEKALLNTLLIIILTSLGAGTVLAVAAGFFLARRALEPIQTAWEKQQQFVSDASHELRTPLSIIQTRIERLLQAPQATIRDSVQDISATLKETRRLSKLVSHLLTLARSDADRLEIKKEPVLLNDIVRQVFEHFAEIADFQGKNLSLNMGHQPMTILGDAEKIHQLLVILVDNAMKFTKSGGHILITCTLENHAVLMSVADDGIGIKKEHLPRIFDRFFQADPSRTDREGTGLGLSIAKWIVDQHKGKISVESEPGKGTRFQIAFPKYKA